MADTNEAIKKAMELFAALKREHLANQAHERGCSPDTHQAHHGAQMAVMTLISQDLLATAIFNFGHRCGRGCELEALDRAQAAAVPQGVN